MSPQRSPRLLRMRPGGFTLLEVLVALAILSLTLMASLRIANASIENTEALRLRQLADWVAANRLAEHQARRDWLPIGQHGGESVQGGVRLHWQEEVSGTPNAQFRRLRIRVRLASNAADAAWLSELQGFLLRPGG